MSFAERPRGTVACISSRFGGGGQLGWDDYVEDHIRIWDEDILQLIEDIELQPFYLSR